MDKGRVKRLRVHQFPEGQAYVPAIRVAGQWLREAGRYIGLGDLVVLRAGDGTIQITKEGVNHDLPGGPDHRGIHR